MECIILTPDVNRLWSIKVIIDMILGIGGKYMSIEESNKQLDQDLWKYFPQVMFIEYYLHVRVRRLRSLVAGI